MSLETLQNAGLSVPDIARMTGKTANYHYQEMSGKTKNILQRVKIYLDKEEGDTLIQWLCSSQDGFFFREPELTSKEDFGVIAVILREFSEYLNCLSTSLADGIISDQERIKLRKEWSDVASVVQSLFAAIDRGDFDG